MNIQKNINHIKKDIEKAQLVVVTKKQTINDIKKVYATGEKNFGENRVNELLLKKDLLPNDIKWHMIGHLQTNKVKLITPFIHLIQSVDSIKLLNKINECGKQEDRIINCLIQIKIAEETTKYGFNRKDSIELLNSDYSNKYPYVRIQGLMGMASFTQNKHTIASEFKEIKELCNNIKFHNKTLSIGMSNDYKIAYQIGSNMVRIGSLIFKK